MFIRSLNSFPDRAGFCLVLRSYPASGLTVNIDVWSPFILGMDWNVMAYRLISGYRRFEGSYSLHV